MNNVPTTEEIDQRNQRAVSLPQDQRQWLDDTLELYEAGHDVQRLHTYPCNQPYNVAAHSWGVALLLTRLHPNPASALLRAALEHDLAERWTGDIPYPAKRVFPTLGQSSKRAEYDLENRLGIMQAELSGEDMAWLKACDMLELWLFCWREYDMGNRRIVDVLCTAERVLLNPATPLPVQDFVLRVLRQRGNYGCPRLDLTRPAFP